jgi:putative transposase
MGHGLLRWSLKPNITSVARLLAYVTGLVNQELLLKNEYLLAENRILKTHLQPGFRLSRPERTTLAEIGKRLGRKLLQQVASIANPDTILGWYRKLVAAKFDGSRQRRLPGRPRIAAEIERLVVRLARENSGWGYDRIVGALANLGHSVSDQTVGNILRRHGIAPAPERKRTTTWKEFIRSHMAVLAGTDFFSVEVLTWRGLVTYYVLFFLHLETRRVTIAGITDQPEESWMEQMARNVTFAGEGCLSLSKGSLSIARPRCEVLRVVSGDSGSRRREVPAATCAQPESEGLCFTLHLFRTS